MRIVVSACLLGENCKYNGGNNYSEALAAVGRRFMTDPFPAGKSAGRGYLQECLQRMGFAWLMRRR